MISKTNLWHEEDGMPWIAWSNTESADQASNYKLRKGPIRPPGLKHRVQAGHGMEHWIGGRSWILRTLHTCWHAGVARLKCCSGAGTLSLALPVAGREHSGQVRKEKDGAGKDMVTSTKDELHGLKIGDRGKEVVGERKEKF